MQRRRGWRTGFVVLLTGAALSTGCSYSQPAFKATRLSQVATESAVPILVQNSNGSIVIQPGTSGAVEVTAKLRATTQERLDRTEILSGVGPDGVLTIGVAWADGERKSNEGCSFSIATPWATSVDVKSSNGDITLSGMTGPSRVETSNGAVRVLGHTGPLGVETSNGSLTLELVGQGPLIARTSNGSVRLTTTPALGGTLRVRTSNGSIAVASGGAPAQKQPDKNATLRIGAGDTESSVRTSNGSVTVTIEDETI